MLDAVVIACICKQKVHFTIRSDMFNNPIFGFLLKFLNGIPVYRASEEKGKIKKNFSSIQHCADILKKGGIIIVFSEGITEHDWKLKPLKSGTAKIVYHALQNDDLKYSLQVVPVGITYSNYEHPAKTIIIKTGEVIFPGRIPFNQHTGAWKKEFNTMLFQKLQTVIPQMESDKKINIHTWQIIITNLTVKENGNKRIKQLHVQGNQLTTTHFQSPVQHKLMRYYLPLHPNEYYNSYFFLAALCIPALTGFLLNCLFYLPVSTWARIKTRNTIFYDSLLCGLITICYPLYVMLISAGLHYNTAIHFVVWLPLIPLTGWITVRFWVYWLKIKNYCRLTLAERRFLQDAIAGKNPGQ